ncbi:MAG: hypothetical protein M1401_08395 [Chloroflexi bacterium]|nr:hypothetical protein [Chloroflexota bacterium]MCL5108866.1 hypothetical protein [Chloroflexota bacterium]
MLEGFRDILIVVLFFLLVVVIALLAVLILQVYQLVRMVRGEVAPILDSMKRTSTTVRGTAEFVGETTVIPLIRVVSTLAAAVRFVRAFLGLTNR